MMSMDYCLYAVRGRLWRDVLEFGAMRGTLVGAGCLPFRTTWLQR